MSCLRPYTKKNGEAFPCGKCQPCIHRHTSGWAFRLMQEEKTSTSSQFITFTYDTTNLHYSPTGKRTLYKRDIQLFFKRLRKYQQSRSLSTLPIKYYCVGEYGSKTQRPHYHAIIFNADENLIELAWSKRGKGGKQQPVPIGEIYYGDVSGHSIGYTLKYISKGRTVPQYFGDDRQKEFSLISKGIGMSYLTEQTKKYHLADLYNRPFLVLPGGVKTSMPRYYYDKIYDGYKKDLLKMSGSLIRQDEFYQQFIHGMKMTQQQIQKECRQKTQRELATFRRQLHHNQKLQKI